MADDAGTAPEGSTRSVEVAIRNEVDNVTLHRMGANILWGRFANLPPERIEPKQEAVFTAYSSRMAAGVVGSVQYRLGNSAAHLVFTFKNPYLGPSSFAGDTADMVADSVFVDTEVEAEGAHAKVLFVALPGGDPLSNSMVATPAPVIAEDPETEDEFFNRLHASRRSIMVAVENATRFVFTRAEDNLVNGTWVSDRLPPESIAPGQRFVFGCRGEGRFTGVQGSLRYRADDCGNDVVMTVSNPFYGNTKFEAHCGDDEEVGVHVDAANGIHAAVVFTMVHRDPTVELRRHSNWKWYPGKYIGSIFSNAAATPPTPSAGDAGDFPAESLAASSSAQIDLADSSPADAPAAADVDDAGYEGQWYHAQLITHVARRHEIPADTRGSRAVVIDNGGAVIKVGMSGLHTPEHVPALAGTAKASVPRPPTYGHSVKPVHDKVSTPLGPEGVDVDNAKPLWAEACIDVEPAGKPLVATYCSLRQDDLHIVREGLEAALSPSQIYMLPDASAVAYAYCLQRGTGLVVDFGWSSTRVSAFDNFSALSTSFTQQGINLLTEDFRRVLAADGVPHMDDTFSGRRRAKTELFAHCVFPVAFDDSARSPYNRDIATFVHRVFAPPARDYGTALIDLIGSEIASGVEKTGLTYAHFLRNICVAGGGVNIRGFREQLAHEINAEFGAHLPDGECRLLEFPMADAGPEDYAYIGAELLGCHPSLFSST